MDCMRAVLFLVAVFGLALAVTGGKTKEWVEVDFSKALPRVFAGLVAIGCALVLYGQWNGWFVRASPIESLYAQGKQLQDKGKFAAAIKLYGTAFEEEVPTHLAMELNTGLAESREALADQMTTNGTDAKAALKNLLEAAADNRNKLNCEDCKLKQSRDLEKATGLESIFPDFKLAEAWESLARRQDNHENQDRDPAAAQRSLQEALQLRPDASTYRLLATELAATDPAAAQIMNRVASCLERIHLQPSDNNQAYSEFQAGQAHDVADWGEALCHYERAQIYVRAHGIHDNWTAYLYRNFANALNQVGSNCRALKESEMARGSDQFNFSQDPSLQNTVIPAARQGCPGQ
jgi:hypothetical protein